MKTLWFTNTPALGESFLSGKPVIGGGWIKALDGEMQKKVALHIAFYHKENILPFKYGNTHYYPIFKGKQTLFRKYIDKKLSRIVLREDVEKYLDIINEVKPDIIHIHGTENPFGYIIERVEIPVIVSIQGNITVCYHKYLSGLDKKYLHITNRLIFKLLAFRPLKISYKMFKSMKRREEDVLSLCKNIIGRTSWDRRISSVLSPNSSYYHCDEILRDGFYCNEWQSNINGKFIIFTTNGNTFYKGFETLCQAVSLLIDSGYTDFEWRVAGISINDLIVKAVKKKLSLIYPKTNLVLMGKLSEQDMIDNLLKSNLFVMTSHIENSPNNLCEAMILGMPCIATYAGGTGSLLDDGIEGVLIQDGDPWAMAGAILELNEDIQKALAMGDNARKRALQRHDKDRISNELVGIYSNILSIHQIPNKMKN